jgi:hypothetical protein
MLALVLQIFLGKERLVKNQLISALDKVTYYIGTFYRAQRNLSLLHKIQVGDQLEKLPVFLTCVF